MDTLYEAPQHWICNKCTYPSALPESQKAELLAIASPASFTVS